MVKITFIEIFSSHYKQAFFLYHSPCD